MHKRFEKYIDEMTLSSHGYYVAGKKASDLDSLLSVSREYLSDAEKMYWSSDPAGAIKALEILQKKVLKDAIEFIKYKN